MYSARLSQKVLTTVSLGRLSSIHLHSMKHNPSSPARKSKNFLFLATLFMLLFQSTLLLAQNPNDFRTRASGNWNVAGNWERFNGTDWEAAAYWPGSGGLTASVEITHAIIVPNNITLIIPGSLSLSGSLELSNRDFTVEGVTILSGVLSDRDNAGANTFHGKLNIINTGALDNLRGAFFLEGIDQTSSGNSIIQGTTRFRENDQAVTGNGSGILRFYTVTIDLDVELTNERSVQIYSALNGLNEASAWINAHGSVLDYSGTTAPMTVGELIAIDLNNQVLYSRTGGDQAVKTTNYFHLHIVTGVSARTKRLENIAGEINVFGNLFISANATLMNGTGVHQKLTVHGNISNHGSLQLQTNATSFCDLEILSEGTVISGNGAYRLRSLTLTHENPKTIQTTSAIDFYGGIVPEGNQILNLGGHLLFLTGVYVFWRPHGIMCEALAPSPLPVCVRATTTRRNLF
ncbi:MAG: hypothetical protein ACK4VN_11495 [Bacteroidales bacterium]